MSPSKNRSNRTAVIVLGMHRSGTSALAGVLNLLGCDEPATLMASNPYNEKGYFESVKLYQLHTQIFASAATHWDDWLPMPAGWFGSPRAAEFHDRAVETMTAEFGRSRLFVVKDPRICRLVPFWKEVLVEIGATPGYVLTHRHPLEVAASLHKRDGMSTGQGLLIWLRHVLEAEYDTRGHPRCFTSFGQLITNWVGVIEKIQSNLSLSLPRFSLGAVSEVDAFLEGSLWHHQEPPEKVLHNSMLSNWVRDSYEILERWAANGEDPGDHGPLDAIRTAFNASAPAFAQIIQSGRLEAERLSGDVERLTSELGALKDEKAATATRLEELRVGVANREAAVKKAKDELAASKILLAEREEALQKAEAKDTAQAAELEELRSRLAHEQSALEQRSHEAEEAHKALEALRAEAEENKRVHAAQLAEREEALRKAEAKDATQAAELEELQSRLAREQSALEQRSHEAEETHKALEALRAEAEENKRAHAAQHAEREEESKAAAQAIERERRSAADRLEQERTARRSADARAADLDDQVQAQFREMSELSRMLVHSEQMLAREQSALEQRSHEAEETHKALEALRAEREEESKAAAQAIERERQSAADRVEQERTARRSADARAADLDDQVQTQFREMSELSRMLIDSEQMLAREQSALEQRSHEAHEAHKALEAQLAEREEVLRQAVATGTAQAAEIAALHNSNSWRLTQPLRSVADWIRGRQT